jgi:hypothetical protein
LSKAHHVTAKRADFAAAAQLYWQTYYADMGIVPWSVGLEARAVRHTLACLLARVAGRSPLEYLDASERARQQDAVLALLTQPPQTISELIRQFIHQLDVT